MEAENDILRFPDDSTMDRDELGDWADYALLQLGYQGWRGHQRDALLELMLGRDVFALMPTGTGKSLVYQAAAKLAESTADSARFFAPLILVVSPLKSLQADQLRAARALGLDAAAVNSDMARYDVDDVMGHLSRYRILFVAPEQLRNAERRAAILPRVALIVVDEAHCVSSWGHDFRPSYARLAEVLLATSREARGWHAPVLLLTATATEAVIGDVLRTLKLDRSTTVLSSRPLADNIALNALELRSPTRKTLEAEQANWVLNQARKHQQAIVYCQSQAEVDRWLEAPSPLLAALDDGLVGFHADSPIRQRTEAMERMHDGRARVGVFTCAAGMGIDWGRVDLVVHKRPPDRLEAMVQEAGRAGRAGQRADHWLLWDRDCWQIPEMFLASSNPTIEEYRRVWEWLMSREDDLFLKSQKAIGAEAGVSEYTTPTIIKQLKSWDLIELRDQAGQVNIDPATGRKIHHATKWLEIHTRCPFEDLPLDAKLLAEKLERDRKGLEAIQRYCANRRNLCREAIVDLWFRPSVADPKHRCGRCDVCTSF